MSAPPKRHNHHRAGMTQKTPAQPARVRMYLARATGSRREPTRQKRGAMSGAGGKQSTCQACPKPSLKSPRCTDATFHDEQPCNDIIVLARHRLKARKTISSNPTKNCEAQRLYKETPRSPEQLTHTKRQAGASLLQAQPLSNKPCCGTHTHIFAYTSTYVHIRCQEKYALTDGMCEPRQPRQCSGAAGACRKPRGRACSKMLVSLRFR